MKFYCEAYFRIYEIESSVWPVAQVCCKGKVKTKNDNQPLGINGHKLNVTNLFETKMKSS